MGNLMFNQVRESSDAGPCNFTSNQEIYDRTFLSEMDCL